MPSSSKRLLDWTWLTFFCQLSVELCLQITKGRQILSAEVDGTFFGSAEGTELAMLLLLPVDQADLISSGENCGSRLLRFVFLQSLCLDFLNDFLLFRVKVS